MTSPRGYKGNSDPIPSLKPNRDRERTNFGQSEVQLKMAATELRPLQSNESGEQVFKASFLFQDVYESQALPLDFLVYHTVSLDDLYKAGVGAEQLPNIYQNYKINRVEYCFHTVVQKTGDPTNWYVWAAPWNRPFFCATSTSCKINPNMLPGCVFKVFNTGGFGTKIDVSGGEPVTEGGTNAIGAGGALFVEQNDPKYYLSVIDNAFGETSALPMSQKLPTYTQNGIDKTKWATVLTRHRVFSGTAKPIEWHYMTKIEFEFSGVRLSPAISLTDPEHKLGAHIAHPKLCVPTFDDPATEKQLRTLLCGESERDHKRRCDTLACIRKTKSESENQLLRRTSEDVLDQTPRKRRKGSEPVRIHHTISEIHREDGPLPS